MMTAPIADMLTRIRNASNIERPFVEMAATKIKVALAEVLLKEGFILGYRTGKTSVNAETGAKEFAEVRTLGEPHVVLQVFLKYGPGMERVITDLQRVSRPGCRIYCGKDQIPRVYGGLGINILSTSRGVMTGRQAAKTGVGGEILCNVW